MESHKMEHIVNRTQNFLGGYADKLEQELNDAQTKIKELTEQLAGQRGEPPAEPTGISTPEEELKMVKTHNLRLRRQHEEDHNEILRNRLRIEDLNADNESKDKRIAELEKMLKQVQGGAQ